MSLQAPAPLHRNLERIDQRGEQPQIADLHVELGEARGAQRIDRKPHDLDIGGGAILKAKQLGTRLIKLRRAMRLQRLMPECETVVTEPRGIGLTAFDLHPAHRNGEIGTQTKFASRRIGQFEGPSADFLARAIEKDVGRLKDRRLAARITLPRKRTQNGAGLRFKFVKLSRIVGRKRGHLSDRLPHNPLPL